MINKYILILCLFTICFAGNSITLEDKWPTINLVDTITLDDLVYRPHNIYYPNPIVENDTTYSVIKKDKSYLIIMKYYVIDTIEVQKK